MQEYYERLKEQIIREVKEILDNNTFIQGIDIHIHVDIDDAPVISYEVHNVQLLAKMKKADENGK